MKHAVAAEPVKNIVSSTTKTVSKDPNSCRNPVEPPLEKCIV
jgi:hypothetical protein